MSTVEEFVRDMLAISARTTPEDREKFRAWVRSLPEADARPEERTTVLIRPGSNEPDGPRPRPVDAR